MKRFLSIISTAAFLLMSVSDTQAQYITTIAGTPDNSGYAGDGFAASSALLYSPSDIAIDTAGNLFFTDFINNVIRKIDLTGTITTVVGNGYGAGVLSGGGGGYTGNGGPATAAELNGPFGIAIDPAGNIYFADGYNHVVRKVDVSGIITTIAGNHIAAYTGDGGPATAASLDNPVGVALDKAGNLYIADDHNNAVRKLATDGTLTTFAGNNTAGHSGDGGPATMAALRDPIGVGVDDAGNVYIADADNNVVRKVDTFGIITNFAGTDSAGYYGDSGMATAARLRSPERVNFDHAGNVYISDFFNNVIRQVSPSGIITTYAGNGIGAGTAGMTGTFSGDDSLATNAGLWDPSGIVFDNSGISYLCDRGNEIIRRIGPQIWDNTAVRAVQSNVSGALDVYPNPSVGGRFTMNLISSTTENMQIRITNVLGQTVESSNAITGKPVTIKIGTTPGVYFVHVTTTNGSWIKQITVE